MTYVIELPNGKLRVSDEDFKPYRKKPTLAIQTDNAIAKIASFNDIECAKIFLKMFGYKEVSNDHSKSKDNTP